MRHLDSIVREGPRDAYVKILRTLYRLFPFQLEGDGKLAPVDSSILVSLVIPTHTRPPGQLPFPCLATCLQSLAEQEGSRGMFEVIIVEDGPPSPDTPAVVKGFESQLTLRHILAGPVHKPLGFLRNLGLASARGRWILMMDDDTILDTGFFQGFLRIADQVDSNCEVVLPRGKARYGLLKERFDFYDEFSLATGCIIYPRRILEKVRGFQSDLPWFVDIDLAIRSILAGARSLKAGGLQFFNPPLYIQFGSEAAVQRGSRYSQAYRHLAKIYSKPIFLALILKDILNLRYLIFSTNPGKRTLGVLAFYTLRGLLFPIRRSS